jgi:putative transposase
VEQAIDDVSAVLGERRTCAQFGFPRGTYQRRRALREVDVQATATDGDAVTTAAGIREPAASRQVQRDLARRAEKSRRACPRALSAQQRQALLDAVHQKRFIDRSVPYIYATLLDENQYYGSISTMYRVLHSVGEVGERRDHATRPTHVKPELCATGPNQVYAWDSVS